MAWQEVYLLGSRQESGNPLTFRKVRSPLCHPERRKGSCILSFRRSTALRAQPNTYQFPNDDPFASETPLLPIYNRNNVLSKPCIVPNYSKSGAQMRIIDRVKSFFQSQPLPTQRGQFEVAEKNSRLGPHR